MEANNTQNKNQEVKNPTDSYSYEYKDPRLEFPGFKTQEYYDNMSKGFEAFNNLKNLKPVIPLEKVEEQPLKFSEENINYLKGYTGLSDEDKLNFSSGFNKKYKESSLAFAYKNRALNTLYENDNAAKNLKSNIEAQGGKKEDFLKSRDLLIKLKVLEPYKDVLGGENGELYTRMLRLDDLDLAELLNKINTSEQVSKDTNITVNDVADKIQGLSFVQKSILKGIGGNFSVAKTSTTYTPNFSIQTNKSVGQIIEGQYHNLPKFERFLKGDTQILKDWLTEFENKEKDALLENSKQDIELYANELSNNYSDEEINEQFNSIASDYIPTYLAFSEEDEITDNFGLKDKLNIISTYNTLKNKDPYLAEVYASNLDNQMTKFIQDNQDIGDKSWMLTKQLGRNFVTGFLDTAQGLKYTYLLLTEGKDAAGKYLNGVDANGNYIEHWLYGKAASPQYLRDVKTYGTLDSDEINQYKMLGKTPYRPVVLPGEETDFFSFNTVYSIAEQGEHVLSMLYSGGMGSTASSVIKGIGKFTGNVLSKTAKAVKIPEKFVSGVSKLTKNTTDFVSRVSTLGKWDTKTLLSKLDNASQLLNTQVPMSYVMASSTHDEVKNALEAKIKQEEEDYIQFYVGNMNPSHKEKIQLDYLQSEDNKEYINSYIEEAFKQRGWDLNDTTLVNTFKDAIYKQIQLKNKRLNNN